MGTKLNGFADCDMSWGHPFAVPAGGNLTFSVEYGMEGEGCVMVVNLYEWVNSRRQWERGVFGVNNYDRGGTRKHTVTNSTKAPCVVYLGCWMKLMPNNGEDWAMYDTSPVVTPGELTFYGFDHEGRNRDYWAKVTIEIK